MWRTNGLFFLLFISCSGCLLQDDPIAPPQISDIEKTPPVKLEVSQAFTVQNSLFLKVRIEALHSISADDVEIAALGLHEGTLLAEQKVRLSNVVRSKNLIPGESYLVPFELSISKISEFQLKCSWGDEVRKNIENSQKSQRTDDLEPPDPYKPGLLPELKSNGEFENSAGGVIERSHLRSKVYIDEIEILEERCDVVVCDISSQIAPQNARKVTIKAKVKNMTNSPVRNLSLAFGLFWAQQGKIPELPKDRTEKKPSEQELEFKNLTIPPGGSVPFNVKLDRVLVELPEGSFRPHVRILSFD